MGDRDGTPVGCDDGVDDGTPVGETDGEADIVGDDDGKSLGAKLIDGEDVGVMVGW